MKFEIGDVLEINNDYQQIFNYTVLELKADCYRLFVVDLYSGHKFEMDLSYDRYPELRLTKECRLKKRIQ